MCIVSALTHKFIWALMQIHWNSYTEKILGLNILNFIFLIILSTNIFSVVVEAKKLIIKMDSNDIVITDPF